MQARTSITIPVKLDEKTFRRFARFDTLILRKRWVKPAVFCLILTAFAGVALFSGRKESGLIAAVLLCVGLGLPVVYFGSFLSQVNVQALRSRLKPARRVYTVGLNDAGIEVENNQKKEERLTVLWRDVRQAYRVPGCVYLYVSPVRAFLLPDGQADAPDETVWQYLQEHLGKEKCKDSNKKRRNKK